MLWIKLFVNLLFTSDTYPFLQRSSEFVKLECYINRGLKTIEKPPTSNLNNFPWVGSQPWRLSPRRFLRRNVLAKHLRRYINLLLSKALQQKPSFNIIKQFLTDCLVCAQTLNVTLQLKRISVLAKSPVLIWPIKCDRCRLSASRICNIHNSRWAFTCGFLSLSRTANKSRDNLYINFIFVAYWLSGLSLQCCPPEWVSE